MILKRRTPQNIVWGGAAGCMPVLIGWSAVTGGVSWTAALLFGVIFFWTPPHYWPLSMKFRRDYAAAGVPMLPVVAKDTKVAREMIAYTVAMIACSLPAGPGAGHDLGLRRRRPGARRSGSSGRASACCGARRTRGAASSRR